MALHTIACDETHLCCDPHRLELHTIKRQSTERLISLELDHHETFWPISPLLCHCCALLSPLSCFRVTFYQCIATMSLLEEDPYLRDLLLHDEGDLLNEMYAWPTRDLLDYKSRLARFYDRASPYHGSVRCLPSSLNSANPNLLVKWCHRTRSERASTGATME